MFGWLFGKKSNKGDEAVHRLNQAAGRDRTSRQAASVELPAEVQPLLAMQRAYWRFDEAEKARLTARLFEELSWAERLRLHHLLCSERWRDLAPAADSDQVEAVEEQETAAPAADLHRQLLTSLLAPQSPYRARFCDVWQGQTDCQRESDLTGDLRNASLTHLGSLEVLHLDPRQPERFQPTRLSFVALDDLDAVMLATPSLFRLAKLFFNDGRDPEVVALPIIYAFTWDTNEEYLRLGRMTRFVGFQQIETAWGTQQVGIGLGQQDFELKSAEGSVLFGMGQVAQIAVALELQDPRFEQKCRARGIDPEAARRSLPPTSKEGGE